MLTRQKLLLELLRQAGRPVEKLELVKWAFLLLRESNSRGGKSFYGFVPYHYGPYSFSLQREMDSLIELNSVRGTENSWEFVSAPAGPELAELLQRDVRHLVHRFKNRSTTELMDYVYLTYPAYTVNSKRQQLASRRVAPLAIYTAGYESLQVEEFLDLLVQTGVQRLVDVRNNPVARRFGFHKSTLQRLCQNLEIDYVHLPDLGIKSEFRQNLESDSQRQELFRAYRARVVTSCQSDLMKVVRLVQEKPSVLVCMEADHHCCHRSDLGEEVAQKTGLPLVHLGATT